MGTLLLVYAVISKTLVKRERIHEIFRLQIFIQEEDPDIIGAQTATFSR